jgi:hypothetical protein
LNQCYRLFTHHKGVRSDCNDNVNVVPIIIADLTVIA